MKKILILISVLFLNISWAETYTVYGISLDLPMGEPDEVLNKNFYLTIGKEQGVYPGAIMDVFRTIFAINGANSLEKINQRVKIGELKVIHAENKASIAIMENSQKSDNRLVLGLQGFRLGDEVAPKISSK